MVDRLDGYLRKFEAWAPIRYQSASSEMYLELQGLKPLIERVLATIDPSLAKQKYTLKHDWDEFDELARRAREGRALAETKEEFDAHLGPTGPAMSASRLHPWVWQVAQSPWGSGHRRNSVATAAQSINDWMQSKVGRSDISESDLVNQALSKEPAEVGKPRLRPPDEDRQRSQSLLDGVRALGDGLFKAVRNLAVHDAAKSELDEQVALEQLAALSLFARLVDEFVVERANTAPPPAPNGTANTSG